MYAIKLSVNEQDEHSLQHMKSYSLQTITETQDGARCFCNKKACKIKRYIENSVAPVSVTRMSGMMHSVH